MEIVYAALFGLLMGACSIAGSLIGMIICKTFRSSIWWEIPPRCTVGVCTAVTIYSLYS